MDKTEKNLIAKCRKVSWKMFFSEIKAAFAGLRYHLHNCKMVEAPAEDKISLYAERFRLYDRYIAHSSTSYNLLKELHSYEREIKNLN